MAIMTGVQSAQVLGPTTQKQANKSREAIEGVDDASFDASENVGDVSASGGSPSYGETDGGQDTREKNNGLDVVRTSR
jgi:cell division protein FtsZ